MIAPVAVSDQGGTFSTTVNETLPGGDWQLLFGNQTFAAGSNGFVRLGNSTGETGKIVISDAVMFAYTPGQDLPVNGNPPAWWLQTYFGTTNVNSAAPGANGLSLLSDYILGISPTDLRHRVESELPPDGQRISGAVHALPQRADLSIAIIGRV